MNHEYGYNISPGGGGRANPNNTDTHKQCPVCKQIKSRKDDYWQSKYTHDGVAYCYKI